MMNKKQKNNDAALLEAATMSGDYIPEEKPKPFNFEGFEFKTIADFDVYNAEVRKHNRMCVHERNKMKIRVPDESFYKKYKTKFHKFQQMENVQKIRIRNKEIDWRGQLKSGGTYMLPLPVINFLNKLSIPEFAEVKTEHGSAIHSETKQVGETPRFTCNVLEYS